MKYICEDCNDFGDAARRMMAPADGGRWDEK